MMKYRLYKLRSSKYLPDSNEHLKLAKSQIKKYINRANSHRRAQKLRHFIHNIYE